MRPQGETKESRERKARKEARHRAKVAARLERRQTSKRKRQARERLGIPADDIVELDPGEWEFEEA